MEEQSRNFDIFGLSSNFLVASMQKRCGIPNRLGQCYVELWLMSRVQRINLELRFLGFPVSFSAHSEFSTVLSLLGRPVGSSSLMVRSTVFELSAQFSDMLHTRYSTTLRCYQLVVNFDGKTFLGRKSRITIRTSSWDQVSRVVIAHQLIPLRSIWLGLAPSVVCCF